MSRKLAQLLDKPEQAVSAVINKLEEACGLPSEDLRLMTESQNIQKKKISKLGLDPHDTTGPELYHSLLLRYANDSQNLDKALGVDNKTKPADKIRKASHLVKHIVGGQELWGVKPTALKKLLKQSPPRQLMKQMGYRTIDSMLKREAVEGLALVAPYTESKTWQTTFRRATSKLDSSNYLTRPLSLIALDPERFGELDSTNVVFVSQAASSAGLNPAAVERSDTLALAAELLHGLQQLGIATSTEALLKSHPALNFWQGTDHLIYHHDGQTVSFNLKDIAYNSCNSVDYDQRQQSQGQQSLLKELVSRYQAYSHKAKDLAKDLELEADQIAEVLKPAQLQVAAETEEA